MPDQSREFDVIIFGATGFVGELAMFVKRLGLRTPSESLTMIRDDRDGRRR